MLLPAILCLTVQQYNARVYVTTTMVVMVAMVAGVHTIIYCTPLAGQSTVHINKSLLPRCAQQRYASIFLWCNNVAIGVALCARHPASRHLFSLPQSPLLCSRYSTVPLSCMRTLKQCVVRASLVAPNAFPRESHHNKHKPRSTLCALLTTALMAI